MISSLAFLYVMMLMMLLRSCRTYADYRDDLELRPMLHLQSMSHSHQPLPTPLQLPLPQQPQQQYQPQPLQLPPFLTMMDSSSGGGGGFGCFGTGEHPRSSLMTYPKRYVVRGRVGRGGRIVMDRCVRLW